MIVQLKHLSGNWNNGFALAKHSLSSTFTHHDEFGHARYDTVRSDPGEAVYQLKYKHDWSKAGPIARAIATYIMPQLGSPDAIVPMPPSTPRPRQPVTEIARALGNLTGIPVVENMLSKASTAQLKNLTTKEEKAAILTGQFAVADVVTRTTPINVLLLDDLFHTGASMEEACAALRAYPKIGRIDVAAATWR